MRAPERSKKVQFSCQRTDYCTLLIGDITIDDTYVTASAGPSHTQRTRGVLFRRRSARRAPPHGLKTRIRVFATKKIITWTTRRGGQMTHNLASLRLRRNALPPRPSLSASITSLSACTVRHPHRARKRARVRRASSDSWACADARHKRMRAPCAVRAPCVCPAAPHLRHRPHSLL